MPWWLLNEGREWPLKVRPQMTQLPTNLIICCLNLAFSNLEILLPTSQCSKLYYDLGMQPYITFTLLRLDPLRNFHLVPNILLLYPAICWHQKYALWFKQSPGIFLLKKKKNPQNKNQTQTSFSVGVLSSLIWIKPEMTGQLRKGVSLTIFGRLTLKVMSPALKKTNKTFPQTWEEAFCKRIQDVKHSLQTFSGRKTNC